jgi:oligoribonuclease
MEQRDDLLVWMDLEMTSLVNVALDSITEIAVVITDKDLNIVADGPDIVIRADATRFDEIPTDVRELHEKSGILPEILASTVTEQEAQQTILAFVQQYVQPRTSPLCGNSIHMDRLFLYHRMPDLNDYLFYRNIDVSTIKELAKRFNFPLYEEAQTRRGVKSHRAKDDILRSIEELKFYRDRFFKLGA